MKAVTQPHDTTVLGFANRAIPNRTVLTDQALTVHFQYSHCRFIDEGDVHVHVSDRYGPGDGVQYLLIPVCSFDYLIEGLVESVDDL